MQGHADFRFVFEAADPRTMPRTWIDNDDRRLVGVDAVFPAIFTDFRYAQERVIGRMLEAAGVKNDLVLEIQKRG